jgi:hypothetical protein
MSLTLVRRKSRTASYGTSRVNYVRIRVVPVTTRPVKCDRDVDGREFELAETPNTAIGAEFRRRLNVSQGYFRGANEAKPTEADHEAFEVRSRQGCSAGAKPLELDAVSICDPVANAGFHANAIAIGKRIPIDDVPHQSIGRHPVCY